MTQQIPLVDKTSILEKFSGKGAWTFVRIPEIKPDKNKPFGWVNVCGTIDDYEIQNYNLQPIGKGELFLPVKSEIRKKIKKQEGDYVHIRLFEDLKPVEIPEELELCLKEDPEVYETFLSYSDNRKKAIINSIFSAKTDKTKADRIVKTINNIIEKIKN